ncbi:MAG: hypothetical protein OEY64_12120 [Nitrospinota bacterium]|nr:hypothetical protein [Nitrospinota bacterium]
MKYIFTNYLLPAEAGVIMICDDLHAYNLILNGSCSTIEQAYKKAYMQAENLHNMLTNIHRKFPESEQISIVRWIDIAGQKECKKLLKNLHQFVNNDNNFRDIINKFILLNLNNFRWNGNKETLVWEERYILEEIMMSIYITEILGYPRELWENAPKPEIPDPIAYLYNNRPDVLRMLTKKNILERKLEILIIPKKEYF